MKIFIQAVFLSCATISAFSGGAHYCSAGDGEITAKSAEDDYLSELRKLANADPVKDFEAAKAKNDIYFIGVRGLSLMVPGVGEKQQHYLKRYITRFVKGTSDAIVYDEQLPLTKKVIVYAEKYNKLVLQFLAEKETKDRGK